jgi:hypothetical protein
MNMDVAHFLKWFHRRVPGFFLVAILISCPGCASLVRFDGPYEGQVVDAATNLPIEGAVVDGTWFKVGVTPASKMKTYYDSQEVLTDKNGKFKIPGKGLLIFSSVDTVYLTIFKAGYEQFPRQSRWEGLIENGPFDKVTWEFDKGIFKLKRLSLEKRRNQEVAMPDAPKEKYRLMRVELNKNNIEIGLPKNTIIPVE